MRVFGTSTEAGLLVAIRISWSNSSSDSLPFITDMFPTRLLTRCWNVSEFYCPRPHPNKPEVGRFFPPEISLVEPAGMSSNKHDVSSRQASPAGSFIFYVHYSVECLSSSCVDVTPKEGLSDKATNAEMTVIWSHCSVALLFWAISNIIISPTLALTHLLCK